MQMGVHSETKVQMCYQLGCNDITKVQLGYKRRFGEGKAAAEAKKWEKVSEKSDLENDDVDFEFCLNSPFFVMLRFGGVRRRLLCRSCSFSVWIEIQDLQVREVAKEAVARARRADGSKLVECETYKFRGHSLADPDELLDPGEEFSFFITLS
ncbi:hypothetical protein QQ045_021466 [Rhodiola kirilowii]